MNELVDPTNEEDLPTQEDDPIMTTFQLVLPNHLWQDDAQVGHIIAMHWHMVELVCNVILCHMDRAKAQVSIIDVLQDALEGMTKWHGVWC